jgi:voltage-gated potassium channel
MPEGNHIEPLATPPAGDPDEQAERWELLDHLQRLLEPVMVALGIAFLVLLLIDFSPISSQHQPWLDRALTAIWAVFVGEFLLRMVIAPSKLTFLRANWLSAASLVLPFLRPIRALRAVRAVRSFRLVRLLGGANRGMRVLQRVTGGQQLAYVGALTLLVTLLGAVGVLFFDRHAEGATIRTFGDALWWSTAMVTTINNEKYAVTPEARVIAVLQRIFAVSVFGFVTASIASYLVGRQVEGRTVSDGDGSVQSEHLATLREEQEALRREVRALRIAIERGGLEGRPTPRAERGQILESTSSSTLPAAPRSRRAHVAAGDATEESDGGASRTAQSSSRG